MRSAPKCIPFSKSIKSQQDDRIGNRHVECIPFSKSIKSQPFAYVEFHGLKCIPFSKSIKSQRSFDGPATGTSVSHSQRASNHNEIYREQA